MRIPGTGRADPSANEIAEPAYIFHPHSALTLLIFLCFELGDSIISATLGDTECRRSANHEHLYRYEPSDLLPPFVLELISPRPAPATLVQPCRCRTSVNPSELYIGTNIKLTTHASALHSFTASLRGSCREH